MPASATHGKDGEEGARLEVHIATNHHADLSALVHAQLPNLPHLPAPPHSPGFPRARPPPLVRQLLPRRRRARFGDLHLDVGGFGVEGVGESGEAARELKDVEAFTGGFL